MSEKTIYKPLGYEEMNPVQLALANVDFHLSFIHGALLDSKMPELAEINLEVHKLVDEANDWLEEQGFPCTYRKRVDGKIVRQSH